MEHGHKWRKRNRLPLNIRIEIGMSLKAFHIFFVVVSTVFALAFGAWAVSNYRTTGDFGSLIWGIASLLGAVVLVGYGRWFLRKLKKESYL